MTQRQLVVQGVVISTSVFEDGEETAFGKLGDNALHRPLGDPYRLSEIANAQIRGTRQTDQHVGMIREEGPGGWWCLGCWASHELIL